MEKYLNNDTISIIFGKLNYKYITLLSSLSKKCKNIFDNYKTVDNLLIRNHNNPNYLEKLKKIDKNLTESNKLNYLLKKIYNYNCLKISMIYFDFTNISNSKFRNLERLNLSYCKNIKYNFLEEIINNSPNIKFLSFVSSFIFTNYSFDEKKKIGNLLYNLIYLDFSNNIKITDDIIKPYILNNNLIYLKLNYLYRLTDETLKNISNYNKDLKYLEINYCTSLTKNGILKILKNCENLEVLKICGIRVNNFICYYLKNKPNNLKIIELDEKLVKNKSISIKQLKLSKNKNSIPLRIFLVS